MYPKLKVGINKEFDKIMCLKFLNKQKAGIDFGAGIIKVHTGLQGIENKPLDDQEKQISNYFEEFYQSNIIELEKTRDKFTDDWNKIESDFFKLCNKYFGNLSWPEGRYIGFLSIISCNPRFLDEKTFQVYWKNKKGFVPVAVHEMLHFLFYHILLVNFPSVDVNNEEVWKLSEIFNILILKQPDFVEVTNDPNPSQYPDLLGLQNKLDPVWQETKNANSFLQKSLNFR